MSTVFSVISSAIEKHLVHLWPTEAQQALTRVLYEVYIADGEFSSEERAEFMAFVSRLGTNPEAAQQGDLKSAFAILTQDPRRHRIATAWIAAALFANHAYKPSEKAFVERITSKYGLDGDLLETEIKRIQSRLLAEAMKELLEES